MARPRRPDFTDTYHHIVIRGINGLPIFNCDKKRRKFLDLIREERKTHDLKLYAFGFLSNHWHGFIRRVDQSMARFFQSIKSQYTGWYNSTYERENTLYAGRYYSSIVEAEAYFKMVWLYVQNQGVAAGLYESPVADPGSTAALYAGINDNYAWIDWQEALATLDIPQDTVGIDSDYFVESEVEDELPTRRVRDQFFVAGDDFVEKYMQIRREAVRENPRHETPLSWETLLEGAEALYSVSNEKLLEPTKKRQLNRLRSGLVYAARKYGHKSGAEIAEKLNVSDSTVSRMNQKANEKYEKLQLTWDKWVREMNF